MVAWGIRSWGWQKRSEIRADNRRIVDEMQHAAEPLVAQGDTLSLQKAQDAVTRIGQSHDPTPPGSFLRRVADSAHSDLEALQKQQNRTTPADPHGAQAMALPSVQNGAYDESRFKPRSDAQGSTASGYDFAKGVGALARDTLAGASTVGSGVVRGVIASAGPSNPVPFGDLVPNVKRATRGEAPAAIDEGAFAHLYDSGLSLGALHLTPKTAAAEAYRTVTDPTTYIPLGGVDKVAGKVGGLVGRGLRGGSFGARVAERAAQTLDGLKPAAAEAGAPRVLGYSGALDPAAVLARVTPGSALELAAKRAQSAGRQIPAGAADALYKAEFDVKANVPQAVASAFYHLPGMRRMFRPGEDMPEHILQANTARQNEFAKLDQELWGSRRGVVNGLDSAFGRDATVGGQVPSVRFLGTPEQAAYPGTGTIHDMGQRPSLYALSPEQKAALKASAAHSEAGRLAAVEGHGVEIGKFKPRDPEGIYLPNQDTSAAARLTTKNLKGTKAENSMSPKPSKPRFYDSGRERWEHDMRLHEQGRLTAAEVFVPETNIRKLLEQSDTQIANAAGDSVFKLGLGGMTRHDVITETDPALARAIDPLRKTVQGLRATQERLGVRLRQRVEDMRSGVQRPLASGAPRAEGAMAAPEEGTAQAGWGFMELVSNLPDRAALKTEAAGLRAQLTRDAKGQIRSNAANKEAARRIGELDALDELHYALERANGDLAQAMDYFGESLKRQGFGMESRQSASLRARMGVADAKPGAGRQRPMFNERTGVMNDPAAGVTSQTSDLYTRANVGGDADFAILSEQVKAMDDIMRVGDMEVNVHPALDTFERSGLNEADMTDLSNSIQQSLDVRVGKMAGGRQGRNYGKDYAAVTAELRAAKEHLAHVQAAWKGANTRDYTQVGDGIYRYFPSDQVKHVAGLIQASEHPFFRAIQNINAQVLSGDLSPLFGQQGQIAWLTAPVQTSRAIFGGLMKGMAAGDPLQAFRADTLAAHLRANPQLYADYAFHSGRAITPGNIPHEFAGGYIGRIPGLGPRFVAANEAIYTAVSGAQVGMFERETNMLVARGMEKQEAMAIAARAGQQVIPMPNNAAAGFGRGGSQAQEFGRTAVTSLTFIQRPAQAISEASEGFIRTITPGLQATEAQKLAMHHVTEMAATTAMLAASSAAIEAQRAGHDPMDAAINAVNPWKPDKDFLKLTLPGGATIPLGGPYRALFKAMLPAEVKVAGGDTVTLPFAGMVGYLQNRKSPLLGTARDLVANKDFYGQKIVNQDFPVNLLQIGEYIGEGVIPLSLSSAAAGIRKDEPMSTIVSAALGNLAGTNLALPSAMDRLDNETKDRYGTSFFDSTMKQQGDTLTANPHLRDQLSQERSQRGGATAEYSKAKDDARGQVEALNAQLIDGSVSREVWQREQRRISDELHGKADLIFNGRDLPAPSAEEQKRDPAKKWLALRKQYTNLDTGQLDKIAFNRAMQQEMTPEQQKEAYAAFGADDPQLQRLRSKLADEYYAIPKYVGFTAEQGDSVDQYWNAVLDEVGSGASPRRMIQAVRESGVEDSKVRRALLARAMGSSLTASKARERWARRNPAARPLLGLGRGAITPEEQTAIAVLS